MANPHSCGTGVSPSRKISVREKADLNHYLKNLARRQDIDAAIKRYVIQYAEYLVSKTNSISSLKRAVDYYVDKMDKAVSVLRRNGVAEKEIVVLIGSIGSPLTRPPTLRLV